MADAVMNAAILINPASIWVAAIALITFYVVTRGRIADAKKRGFTAFVSYIVLGAIAGCIVIGLLLGTAMGFPAGPVFVMVVLWPLACSVGAVCGAVLWWRDVVKPNSTLEADAREKRARGST